MNQNPDQASSGKHGVFRTTHWSVVLAARNQLASEGGAALESLCTTYWRPVYYCIRRKGYSPEDAEDLTQAFFAKILKGSFFSLVEKKGLFRTYLLRCMEHFLHNEWERKVALKRGGGHKMLSLDAEAAEEGYTIEPVDHLTPEQLFDRKWAATLLGRVVSRLREEYSMRASSQIFELLEPRMWNDGGGETYSALGARLGMTEDAVKTEAYRLRKRYRELLREEIVETVGSAEEVDSEFAHLRRALSK